MSNFEGLDIAGRPVYSGECYAHMKAENEALQQRVAELERAKKSLLEAARGLQRYRVEPLNPEYYAIGAVSFIPDPRGNAVRCAELDALLIEEADE